MPFKDILGHDREIEILKKAMSMGKVAHSFLFVGPEGVGKRLTAISLAKSLNCSASNDNPPLQPVGTDFKSVPMGAGGFNFNKGAENGVNDDFCGTCQNCKDIENSSYTDLFLIEPREPESKGGGVDYVSGTIKIDAVRDAQQRLSYRAVKGGKKVCIVDGAEKMNRGAQNAFLKTLEEPPSDSIIILIVSDGAVLLPTIVSRCQRINFRPLTQDVVVGIIKQRQGIPEDAAVLISSLSGGSMGKALSWDAESIFEQRNKVVEIFSQLSIKNTEGLFEEAEDIAKGERPIEILEFLKMLYRDIAVLKQGREDMLINSDLLPVLKQHAECQTSGMLTAGFELIHQAQIDIMPPRYANKQLTIENLLLQLAS